MQKHCSTQGCEKPSWCRGLCEMHYRRQQRKDKAENEREHDRKRRHTEKYRAQERARNKRRREKVAAYNEVQQALRHGKLKPEPCAVCGALTTEAHHHDYSKPLDVIWLCRTHHMHLHHPQGREATDAQPQLRLAL